MDLMEAIWSLQHRHVHIHALLLSNLFVAEFTKTIFFLLLDLLVVSGCSLSLPHIHESFDRICIEKLGLLLLNLIFIV